jgi:GMP synthase (glutamine-hydrolysing)
MMRAVVLQHESHEDLGLLGPALTQAGFSLVKRFRSVERADLDAELVLILGGNMSVAEVDQHPFLQQEQAFLSERVALERPCLGICLGAQLIAAAAGSEVFRGKNGFELGVGPVRWMKAASEDPVLAATAKSTVAHWHEDTFTPVPGATLLASTDRYTQQAFRLGPSYAFQFHLELTGAAWLQWIDASAEALISAGKDLVALRAEAAKLKAAESANAQLIDRLIHHFARAARR